MSNFSIIDSLLEYFTLFIGIETFTYTLGISSLNSKAKKKMDVLKDSPYFIEIPDDNSKDIVSLEEKTNEELNKLTKAIKIITLYSLGIIVLLCFVSTGLAVFGVISNNLCDFPLIGLMIFYIIYIAFFLIRLGYYLIKLRKIYKPIHESYEKYQEIEKSYKVIAEYENNVKMKQPNSSVKQRKINKTK